MPTSPNGEIILTKQPTFLQAVSAKNWILFLPLMEAYCLVIHL
jgi:hypothetical protein